MTSSTYLSNDRWYYRALYQLGWWLVVPGLRLYTRMTIGGRENIPESGPFVLAPVHRSYMDTPIAAAVTNRRMRFMGKDSMWKYGWLGRVFSALGAFPVSRGSADREAMNRALRVLNEFNEGLVVFPEGERKQGPLVFPPLDGVVYLALKAGAPIIPVGIGGSEWVMPKSAKFVFPRRVHIEIGTPIDPPTPPDGKRLSRKAYGETAAQLRIEMQRLFDTAMSKVPQDYADERSAHGEGESSDRDGSRFRFGSHHRSGVDATAIEGGDDDGTTARS